MNVPINKVLLFLVFGLTAALVWVVASKNVNDDLSPDLEAELLTLQTTRAELLELRDDIVDLKDSVAQLNQALALTRTISVEEPAAIISEHNPTREVSAREETEIAELKKALDQIRNGLVRSGMVPPGSNEISSAKALILTEQTNVEQKLAALRTLRAVDARSDDVVKQMIQAYYATEDPRLRADIFRQLDGVTTPELRMPLLEAVSKADNAGVREEAAETLAHYLPDPDVQAWLEHLAANDSNEGVRRQAIVSLQRIQPRSP